MTFQPNDEPSQVMRRAFPRLLGSLGETEFAALQPHLVWEWVELAGGEVLFQEGGPSDAIYVVMSGRLQASVAGKGNKSEVVGEIGRGESVGEMGAFTGEPRRATISALRDTLLVRVELAAFHQMLSACPELGLKLNRVIIERLQKRNTSQKPAHNLINLAVLPISEGLDASAVLRDLLAELQAQQSTVLHLTSEVIDAAAGRKGAAQATDEDQVAHRWLIRHLDELEGRYSLILYEADPTMTPWTLRCLRQSDEVLLLGRAEAAPALSEVERTCLNGTQPMTAARQTLVLVHPADSTWATGTPAFLAARAKVYRHFHLRSGQKEDLARLVRFLTGRAVALVLAGGGARGLAHIGVYRALEEAGVQIDSFAGTSIGSVLGACMAADWRWDRVFSENRREFLANPTKDYNLIPLISLLTGRKLDRILETGFPKVSVEELWKPFFCMSSSYTRATEVIHQRGNLKRALLASMAIPGVFPPVVSDGDLLVDGGIFNNMPVDIMARTGVQTILAVDLRPQDQERNIDFTEVPSAWTLLLDRLKPRDQRRYHVPSLLTTLMTASTLNSEQKMSSVVGDVDLLFRPDVRDFGLLEWKSYDQLVERGYRHAQEVCRRRPGRCRLLIKPLHSAAAATFA